MYRTLCDRKLGVICAIDEQDFTRQNRAAEHNMQKCMCACVFGLSTSELTGVLNETITFQSLGTAGLNRSLWLSYCCTRGCEVPIDVIGFVCVMIRYDMIDIGGRGTGIWRGCYSWWMLSWVSARRGTGFYRVFVVFLLCLDSYGGKGGAWGWKGVDGNVFVCCLFVFVRQ